MKQKHRGIFRIGHAILFAAALLISAKLNAGTEYSQILPGLIMALWFASSLMIPGTVRSIKGECACIRRFFSSTKGA